ncbi:MAG: hypothetical protein ACTSUC_08940 [Promethearchaeota archaeon]
MEILEVVWKDSKMKNREIHWISEEDAIVLGWNIHKGGGGGRKNLPFEILVALVAHGFQARQAFNYIRNVKGIKIGWRAFQLLVREHFKNNLDSTGFEPWAHLEKNDIRKYWLNARILYLKPLLEVYLKAGFSPRSIRSKLIGFQYPYTSISDLGGRLGRLFHTLFSQSSRDRAKQLFRPEIIKLIIKGYNQKRIIEFLPGLTLKALRLHLEDMFGIDIEAPKNIRNTINAWKALILPRLQYYLVNQYSDQQICQEFEWDFIAATYPPRKLSDPHEIVSYFVNTLFPGIENSDHARFLLRANFLGSVKWNFRWGDYGWYEP